MQVGPRWLGLSSRDIFCSDLGNTNAYGVARALLGKIRHVRDLLVEVLGRYYLEYCQFEWPERSVKIAVSDGFNYEVFAL